MTSDSDRERLAQIRQYRKYDIHSTTADVTFLLGLVDRLIPFEQYFAHLKSGSPVPQAEFEIWWAELERLDNACCAALGAPDVAGGEGQQRWVSQF